GGTLRGIAERLLAARAVEEKESADQLLGFGEGTIGDAAPAVAHLEPRRLLAQRVALEEHAARFQALVVGEHLPVDRTTFLRRALPRNARAWREDRRARSAAGGRSAATPRPGAGSRARVPPRARRPWRRPPRG